jgi:ankyrin repeat protein
MKSLIAILISITLGKCSPNIQNEKLLANDVRLYLNTPVWEVAQAIQKEDIVKIRTFLEGKPDSLLNYQEKLFGQSLLEWAVYTNHYPSVKVLAELGADPNLQSKNGTSAFIHAADKFETSEYLKLLLKYGGDVNAVAKTNEVQHLRTPLMAAAFKRLESVKLLINAGANPDFLDTINGMQSALLHAFYGDKIDIVKYLIMEVNVNYKRALGATIEGDSLYVADFLRKMPYPLDSEQYKQKMEVVNFLKEKGIDYWKAPIPQHYYENYEADYLKKY